jgi:hypothetical protein
MVVVVVEEDEVVVPFTIMVVVVWSGFVQHLSLQHPYAHCHNCAHV